MASRSLLRSLASLAAVWLAGAAVVPALQPAAAADTSPSTATKRPMTPEDLWAMQRVGAPVLSPDGRWIACAVTTYSMEENKGQGDLWLVDPTGASEPRRLTWNKGPDSSPAWSPDGTRLAYVSKRGDDPAQITLLPMSGGEPRPITELPVAASDPRWLPDGKRIAFLASTWPDLDADFQAVKKRLEEQKSDKTRALATENRLWRYWDHPLTDGQVLHLFVVDVETREVKDLLPGFRAYMDLDGPEGTWDVSPDGSEIAFAANATEPPYRSINFDVWVLPLAGGAPRRITADNPADDVRPRYTPDGRFILYGRASRPEIEADFTRLARYDRKSGTSLVLTESWDAQPASWRPSADGRTILFHAQELGKTHLYALGIDGGTPRLLVRGANTANVASGKGGALFFTRDAIASPPEIWRAQSNGSKPRPLTHFNATLTEQLDLGSERDVMFQGAAGDAVQMWVVLPPGYDAKRRYPLLHVIHGGPHGASLDQFHFRWNAALLASHGFVVAEVNFHGSTGAGQKFCESIVGAHGDKPFTDIMLATDWLIAQGIADSTRMAAAGGSYGGYLVDWILGHTNRFKALVSHAGVYDLMGQFASDATWGRARNYGAEPWEDPARIARWSPNQYAAHFTTPTLVLHGEKDYRVPVGQGIQLYGVLSAKGVPARLVVFPDENHWILKPQASRLWHKELFAWIEKYAGPAGSSDAAGASGSGSGNRAP